MTVTLDDLLHHELDEFERQRKGRWGVMSELAHVVFGAVIGGVGGFYVALYGVKSLAKRDCPSCLACLAKKS